MSVAQGGGFFYHTTGHYLWPTGPRRLWAGVPGGPNTVNPSLQVGKGDRFPGAVLVCTEAGRSASLVWSIVAASATLLRPCGL